MSSIAKKAKFAIPRSIGTHNGSFHCDEVLACSLLLKLFPGTPIIRTRDPAKLKDCDIVVDVGGEYDPDNYRFDHHQKSFTHTMSSLDSSKTWTTKLSSSGLVYLHYGRDVISKLIERDSTDADVELIWDKVYEILMQSIDAIDNGISIADAPLKYHISTDLSSRVQHLNPWWNDPKASDENYVNERFNEAIAMVGREFEDRVSYLWRSWMPAKNLVKQAYDERFEVDKSGEIMLLENGGFPWKDHLYSIEDPQAPSVKYVMYQDQNKSWRVQCVPVELGSFQSRLGLPERWRGLRDEELSKEASIEGCVFVHASGFIGGNKSKQGTLDMARKSLLTAAS